MCSKLNIFRKPIVKVASVQDSVYHWKGHFIRNRPTVQFNKLQSLPSQLINSLPLIRGSGRSSKSVCVTMVGPEPKVFPSSRIASSARCLLLEAYGTLDPCRAILPLVCLRCPSFCSTSDPFRLIPSTQLVLRFSNSSEVVRTKHTDVDSWLYCNAFTAGLSYTINYILRLEESWGLKLTLTFSAENKRVRLFYR